MSFNDFCRTFRVSPTDRDKLAWHLATYRMKRTYEELRHEPDTDPRNGTSASGRDREG